MTLNEFIYNRPYGTRREVILKIAKELRVSESYVMHMVHGRRRTLEKYAVGIEKATGGKVRRQDICPHMYE